MARPPRVPVMLPWECRVIYFLTVCVIPRRNALANDAAWRALLRFSETWKPPIFALDGNDVMALGIDEGPEIGVALRDIEQWWVEQDFAPDRTALLQRLKEIVMKRRV